MKRELDIIAYEIERNEGYRLPTKKILAKFWLWQGTDQYLEIASIGREIFITDGDLTDHWHNGKRVDSYDAEMPDHVTA